MLQILRNGSRHPLAKVFLGLVVLSFAVLGLGSFIPSMQMKRDFIKAGKTSIDIQEIANDFNNLRTEVAPNMTINEAVDAGLLDILISYLGNEALIIEEAKSKNIIATRNQQKITLAKNKQFQDENGKFSSIKFQTSLLKSGLTEDKYLILLNRSLIKQQLTGTISNAASIFPQIIDTISAHSLEKRRGRMITIAIPSADTIDKPNVSELKDFFDNTSKSWIEPKRRVAKFILLDPSNFAKNIKVTEQDLIEEFDIRRLDYNKEETRSIKQLVFDIKDEGELALINLKDGKSFDEITSKNFTNKPMLIEDITKGQLADELSEFVFNSKIKDVSKLIETDFGFHLIQIVSIKPEVKATYNEIKETLANDVKLDLATDLIYDIANFADDEFASGSSIDYIAKEKDLLVQFSNALDEQGLNELRERPDNKFLNDKNFLENLWRDDENIQLSINETEDGKFFALEIDREIPELLPNFDKIQDKLEIVWLKTKAVEKAIKKSEELSKLPNLGEIALNTNLKIENIKAVTKNDENVYHKEILNALFRVKEINGNQTVFSNEGVSLIILDEIISADNVEIKKRSKVIAEPYNSSMKNDLSAAFISRLENKHSLKINKPLILEALGLVGP